MQWKTDAMRRKAAFFLCAGLAFAGMGCADKHAAIPPTSSCTTWAATSTGHSNAEPSGLGCANALNLRAMVADPNDIKVGKLLGPADGAREALAVEAYKQGKVKELKGPGNSSSIVMPVGGTK